jgi:hypothetical protein
MAAWASVRLISGATACLRTVGTIHSGRVGIGTLASHIKKPVEIVAGDRRRSLRPANYKGALSAAAAALLAGHGQRLRRSSGLVRKACTCARENLLQLKSRRVKF